MLMLTPLQIIFYVFSVIAVGSGIIVITARNPVRSVLSLVVTFFALACLWMMLQAEFLSLILLLVYVGAVMTLFLFVVMMLNIDQAARREGFVRYLPYGVIVVLLIIGLIMMTFYTQKTGMLHLPVPPAVDSNNIERLGKILYTDYVYPFQIAGVLLLVAIIAAITLTHRPPTRRKNQRASDQINIKLEDRIRLVSMPSQSKQGEE